MEGDNVSNAGFLYGAWHGKKVFTLFFLPSKLRACLRGVGDPGLVG